MTRATNARVAGFTFLFYIVVGIKGAADWRVGIVLSLLQCFSALVLAVTLYAITSAAGRDVAMLALTFRVGEGILGAIFISGRVALASLVAAGATAQDAAMAHAVNDFFVRARSLNNLVGATFFAVGSTLFCWLLLRGRMIPAALAWLGVIASILLVVCLPLQLAGALSRIITQLMWLPMLAFEVPLGLLLLVKGVETSR